MSSRPSDSVRPCARAPNDYVHHLCTPPTTFPAPAQDHLCRRPPSFPQERVGGRRPPTPKIFACGAPPQVRRLVVRVSLRFMERPQTPRLKRDGGSNAHNHRPFAMPAGRLGRWERMSQSHLRRVSLLLASLTRVLSSCLVTAGARTFDLSELAAPVRYVSQQPESRGWTYSFSACGEVLAGSGPSCKAVTPHSAVLEQTVGACNSLGTLATRMVEAKANGVAIYYSGGDGGRSIVITVECADLTIPKVVRWGYSTGTGTYAALVHARSGCAVSCARDAAGAICGGAARGVCVEDGNSAGGHARCACAKGHSGAFCADLQRYTSTQVRGEVTSGPSFLNISIFLGTLILCVVFMAKWVPPAFFLQSLNSFFSCFVATAAGLLFLFFFYFRVFQTVTLFSEHGGSLSRTSLDPAAGAAGAAVGPFPLPAWAPQAVQGITRYSSLDAAAAKVAEPMRWGRSLVPFVSGNNAMVKFMLNEMLHISRHPVPFSILWIPLDGDALTNLASNGNGTVYDGIAQEGHFSGTRSDFSRGAYNSMALMKWNISLSLLDLGYDVLLLDPDLVILRNPLPYFETIAACDISIQLDSTMDPTGDNIVSTGGYSLRLEGLDNQYNTGGILMRGGKNGRAAAWVQSFYSWALSQYEAGSTRDDQGLFNRFVADQHLQRIGNDPSSGQYALNRILNNECYEYTSTSNLQETAVTIWPLNPFMFAPRPHITERHLPKRIAHRPFWWHANWCVTDTEKVEFIKGEGDWLVQ